MKRKDPSWGTRLRRPDISAGGKESRALVSLTIEEWYEEKHRRATDAEIAMVNAAKVATCPFCDSIELAKDGFQASGIRRLRCGKCGRRFNPLTGTIFDSRKIPISERIEFLLHLFEFHSIATSARDNKNDWKTGIVWLHQAFSVLAGSQDGTVLSGRVYVDETFVTIDPEEIWRRPDGKLPRGLSRNRICIATATDGNRSVFVATGAGKPSRKAIWDALGSHIAPGSTIVHDGEKSHLVLIERLGLESEVHPTSETKGLPDSRNPMDPINDIHDKLKRFLRAHGSFARRDLQGWLDLFSFI